MKKGVFKFMLNVFILTGMYTIAFSQENGGQDNSNTNNVDSVSNNSTESDELPKEKVKEASKIKGGQDKDKEDKENLSFVQQLKAKFIEGDPVWMTPVLICLIIGLALSIERIIYLNLSTINTNKFLKEVEDALNSGGVEKAKELCANTRGPIASIFYQGLDRSEEGLEMVEKSVVAYGGVQMGNLEKGLSWLQLFIALSPMLGFLGTVIGMIQAFDKIEAEGGVEPTVVAGGIKVSLLTTVFGLIAAIFLQIFYNYITSKIDGLVNEMEDASITLVDMLLKTKALK